jgi:hypothetical protein
VYISVRVTVYCTGAWTYFVMESSIWYIIGTISVGIIEYVL